MPDTSETPVGPVDATKVPRFAGIATFARLPRREDLDRCDIAVVGMPFDSGTSFRPGARFGPEAIRAASRLLRTYNPALDVSPFEACQVVDGGDLAISPFDIEAAVVQMESGLNGLLETSGRVVTLGGDHTIALPILRALHRRSGPIAVVHFDAHLDTWDTYFGAPFTHGTPFRRASEEGLLSKGNCIHLGIRGPLYERLDLSDDSELGFVVVPAREMGEAHHDQILEDLHARVGDRPVYVSVDVDVLDPGFAPGTGTPEPGGLSSRELLALLRGLRGLPIVGADVVEVAPAYDHAQITAFAAAHVVYELISLMALQPGR
jgi:agmatinase